MASTMDRPPFVSRALQASRASSVGRAAPKLRNLLWERRLGISTHGTVPVDHPDSSNYSAMPYSTVRKVLRRLALEASDVFVDIGSGKGRVLCCAALYPVRAVIGVDLSEELNEQARLNARRAHGLRAPIEVHTAFADEFDYSECTVAFMFSPFGAETLRKVLSKIHSDRRDRPVRIAYANPAHLEACAEQEWLEQYDVWDRDGHEHGVRFYRSATGPGRRTP